MTNQLQALITNGHLIQLISSSSSDSKWVYVAICGCKWAKAISSYERLQEVTRGDGCFQVVVNASKLLLVVYKCVCV